MNEEVLREAIDPERHRPGQFACCHNAIS